MRVYVVRKKKEEGYVDVPKGARRKLTVVGTMAEAVQFQLSGYRLRRKSKEILSKWLMIDERWH
jgi:hypothetical protein